MPITPNTGSLFHAETQKISLSDIDAVVRMDCDAVVYRNSRVFASAITEPPRLPELRKEIGRQIAEEAKGQGMYFAIERKSAPSDLIGVISLAETVVDARLSYRLAPSVWGQGFATEAALSLCAHAIKQRIFSSISALCHRSNARSRRVLQKLGMEVNGIAGTMAAPTVLSQSVDVLRGFFGEPVGAENLLISYQLDFTKCLYLAEAASQLLGTG